MNKLHICISYMNKINYMLAVILLAFIASGCGSSKNVAYLKNSDQISEEDYGF